MIQPDPGPAGLADPRRTSTDLDGPRRTSTGPPLERIAQRSSRSDLVARAPACMTARSVAREHCLATVCRAVGLRIV